MSHRNNISIFAVAVVGLALIAVAVWQFGPVSVSRLWAQAPTTQGENHD